MKSIVKLNPLLKTSLLAAFFFPLLETSLAQVSSGSGTNGRIPLWTGAHSQGNSVMLQASSKIGIGTTTPSSPLTVYSSSVNAIFARSNSNCAVRGYTLTNIGVLGTHGGTTGTAPGVEGNTVSNDSGSAGVLGIARNGYGVQGRSSNGIGGYFTAVDNYAGYFSSTNSDAADFYGASWGIYVRNSGTQPAVDAASTNASSYAGYFLSTQYRAGYFKSGNAGLYSLYVDTQDGPTQGTSGLDVNGSIRAEGNLFVAGSKAGYVVDEMQNADNTPLEAGDVVVVAADSGPPVLGKIPVPRIKLASTAYDTAVVGIVDQIMYVPDESTRFAYEAQRKADREAANQAHTLSATTQQKASPMSEIQNRISDEAGTLHVDASASKALRGGYCSVVTLGSYRIVKVDANYGAIKAGDLLTTSPHAGYAMKVTDKIAASGAIIGKALSSLNAGMGTVSVLVTLK